MDCEDPSKVIYLEQKGEDGFKRIPSDSKYKIFARLDVKSLVFSKVVCKDWNNMLKTSALQALNPSSSSPAFLIHLEDQESESFVTVDHDGKCRTIDTFNGDHRAEWSVSCNGLLDYFPPLFVPQGFRNKIVVCHPLLRWKDIIYLKLNAFDSASPMVGIVGAFWDPLASHLTVVVGLNVGEIHCPCFEMYIYGSGGREWRTVNKEFPVGFRPQNYSAVFSQGCFFWMDGGDSIRQSKGIVGFGLSDYKMHKISLPKCPLHPHTEEFCKDHVNRPHNPKAPNVWQLKGCDGNLVLVYHQTQEYHFSWRLEATEECTWEWHLLSYAPPILEYPCNVEFEADKSGWWLWADGSHEGHVEERINIADEQGIVKYSYPLSYLISLLDIPADAYVVRVFTFQTNNLWDKLASC